MELKKLVNLPGLFQDNNLGMQSDQPMKCELFVLRKEKPFICVHKDEREMTCSLSGHKCHFDITGRIHKKRVQIQELRKQ
jgi:hypothetical protein